MCRKTGLGEKYDGEKVMVKIIRLCSAMCFCITDFYAIKILNQAVKLKMGLWDTHERLQHVSGARENFRNPMSEQKLCAFRLVCYRMFTVNLLTFLKVILAKPMATNSSLIIRYDCLSFVNKSSYTLFTI